MYGELMKEHIDECYFAYNEIMRYKSLYEEAILKAIHEARKQKDCGALRHLLDHLEVTTKYVDIKYVRYLPKISQYIEEIKNE